MQYFEQLKKYNMMDIKVKKGIVVETKVEAEPLVLEKVSTQKVSKFSVALFGFMSVSVIAYVFMISSSVFFAVKASQFAFNEENIGRSLTRVDVKDALANKDNTGRISYINRDSDTAISLK